MNQFNFSTHQNNFESDELRLCREVMGLFEREAVSTVYRNGCFPFVVKREREDISYPNKTAHSYRVNLVIRKGRVISTFVG